MENKKVGLVRIWTSGAANHFSFLVSCSFFFVPLQAAQLNPDRR